MSGSPAPVSEPLPLRWALILLAAMTAGLFVGLLTFAETANWPATLLAALAATAMAVSVLHRLIGR